MNEESRQIWVICDECGREFLAIEWQYLEDEHFGDGQYCSACADSLPDIATAIPERGENV